MKKITLNDDNLTLTDIQNKIIKARAIIINDNKEILLANYAGTFLLPGGKIEDNETIIAGLLREVLEETGIELKTCSLQPLLFIEYFIKNYPRRDNNNIFDNRYNGTYYYIVHTNKKININKINLKDNELEANFKTIRVKLEHVLPLIEQNKTRNPWNKYFLRELKIVIQEFQKDPTEKNKIKI